MQYASEQELLTRLSAGDRIAAESVYRQHYPTVMHWIARAGGTEADAADIFQESMVVLFQKGGNPSFTLTCRIGTYLFAIAKHLWYKRVEALRRGPLPLLIDTDDDGNDTGLAYEEDIAAHHERELHYESLGAALEQIGEPCRGLLQAFYNEGLSMQQIATRFGYTNPDNAKTQKYKCLARLKKIFFGAGARS